MYNRGPPRPLTSRGTSAWPYRVTTQYSFYALQIYSEALKFQNPMIYQRMANPRAHDVASQATDSIRCPRAEGPIIYWITQGLYLTYNCVPQYIWGYFAEMCNKSHWILQRIYRLKVCNRRAFALSRRCRVSRSRPRVSGETITVILLWRHNSGPSDNGESIAAHSNATPITMGSVTI